MLLETLMELQCWRWTWSPLKRNPGGSQVCVYLKLTSTKFGVHCTCVRPPLSTLCFCCVFVCRRGSVGLFQLRLQWRHVEGLLWKTEEAAYGSRGFYDRISDQQDHSERLCFTVCPSFLTAAPFLGVEGQGSQFWSTIKSKLIIDSGNI